MENKELDPKRFFRFLNPLSTDYDREFSDEIDKYETQYEDPYGHYQELIRRARANGINYDPLYELRHWFNNKPLYDSETGEITGYEHTMVQMSDSDVDIVFLDRLIDYRDKLSNFLDFHYKCYDEIGRAHV